MKLLRKFFNTPRPHKRSDGATEWRLRGQVHREDGPAIIYPGGALEWRRHGMLHRADGPAREWPGGTKEWWMDGKRHRDNGPAFEKPDGLKAWFCNDLLHRTDGPAFEMKDGTREWWVDGQRMPDPVIPDPEGETAEAKKIAADVAASFGKGLQKTIKAPRTAKFRRAAP